MLLIRFRTVAAAGLCSLGVLMASSSIAGATTVPPDDTADTAGTTETADTADTAGETTEPAAESTEAPAAGGEVEMLAPDEEWAGVTRAEWETRWWQWAVSIPQDANPNFDTSGERCGYGQSGPVFFMPASFTFEPNSEGLTCVVPEGRAIYVPIIATGCSTVEPPPFFGRDEAELQSCAEDGLASFVEASVAINGQPLDLEGAEGMTSMFTLWFPKGNFYGVEPGVAQSVSAFVSVIIAPPAPGEYVIEGSSMFEGDEEPFTSRTTMIVTPAQVIEPEETTGSTELTATTTG